MWIKIKNILTSLKVMEKQTLKSVNKMFLFFLFIHRTDMRKIFLIYNITFDILKTSGIFKKRILIIKVINTC